MKLNGTSYTKAVNRPDLKEIPIDNCNLWIRWGAPWGFGNLMRRVTDIEDELIFLTKNTPTTVIQSTSPKGSSNYLNTNIGIGRNCCWKNGHRNDKKDLYQKTVREEMEIEGEKLQKTRKHHNKVAIKPSLKTDGLKLMWKKKWWRLRKLRMLRLSVIHYQKEILMLNPSRKERLRP